MIVLFVVLLRVLSLERVYKLADLTFEDLKLLQVMVGSDFSITTTAAVIGVTDDQLVEVAEPGVFKSLTHRQSLGDILVDHSFD